MRGLQLALGLKLLTKGFDEIVGTGFQIAWDSVPMASLCFLVVLLLYFSNRVPGALVIFGIGLVALFSSQPAVLSGLRIGFDWTLPSLSGAADWKTGILRGAIPQIPLTTLNSVIAVCALSTDLFPDRAANPRKVATSVGLMNLVCCPLGGMPMCHGAGGLAAQYRFGARTGGSVVMLGIVKMALGLLFGGSLLAWLQAYPKSVLGVLLVFSGLELALVCRDQTSKVDFFVMIITAGACLAVNTAVGFVVGWAIAVLLIWGVFKIEQAQSPSSGGTHQR